MSNNELNHISFLMDGNRKWARANGREVREGHKAGLEVLNNICSYCIEREISYLTVYAFSTDNWGRDEKEVRFLLDMLFDHLKKYQWFLEKDIRVYIAGSDVFLKKEEIELLQEIQRRTSECKKLTLTIAFNYNGQEELVHALNEIIRKRDTGELVVDHIDERVIEKYIYTSNIPDPDLIIRTAGVKRLTRFLLWRSSYSEVLFLDKYWPDFTEEDFEYCLEEFKKRNRRFGK